MSKRPSVQSQEYQHALKRFRAERGPPPRVYGGVALSKDWPHAFKVKGSDNPESLPEGLHQVTRTLWAAVHRDRSSCGTDRSQLCSLANATKLLRRITANEPRPLGGSDAGKLETERVWWALIRVAVESAGGSPVGPKAANQLRGAVANALGITVSGTEPPSWASSTKLKSLSHGDVWASATGVPGFGEAVERLVDPVSRSLPPPLEPGQHVRVDKKHMVALMASPLGRTLAKRTCAVQMDRGCVVVDPAFLKPSVALAWATERCLAMARTVGAKLDGCTSEADLAALVTGIVPDDCVHPDFRYDGTSQRVWKMIEARRIAAKRMLADALGISVHFDDDADGPTAEVEVKDSDIAWAPCLRQLQSPEPPLYEFMNDLRVTTAVVVEDFARLLGRHAADVFGGDSAMLGGMLGATWERSSDERKAEFRRILKRFRSRPLAGGQLCSVIRRRTEVGKPGFHCPASSCAECHASAGLSDNAATAAATPGMVTLALTRKRRELSKTVPVDVEARTV